MERRYSETEKETLAPLWACEWFDVFVCGQPFKLETDDKSLERIHSATSKPCARDER